MERTFSCEIRWNGSLVLMTLEHHHTSEIGKNRTLWIARRLQREPAFPNHFLSYDCPRFIDEGLQFGRGEVREFLAHRIDPIKHISPLVHGDVLPFLSRDLRRVSASMRSWKKAVMRAGASFLGKQKNIVPPCMHHPEIWVEHMHILIDA